MSDAILVIEPYPSPAAPLYAPPWHSVAGAPCVPQPVARPPQPSLLSQSPQVARPCVPRAPHRRHGFASRRMPRCSREVARRRRGVRGAPACLPHTHRAHRVLVRARARGFAWWRRALLSPSSASPSRGELLASEPSQGAMQRRSRSQQQGRGASARFGAPSALQPRPWTPVPARQIGPNLRLIHANHGLWAGDWVCEALPAGEKKERKQRMGV